MDNDFVSKFFGLTEEAKSIVVTSHISPDDDSIASVLAVFRLLSLKYPAKKIRIVYSGATSDRYKSFAGFAKIEFVEDMDDHLDDCDLLIMLDGGQYKRFSKKLDPQTRKIGTICIDHHASAPSSFTLSLIRPEAKATVQIIYEQFFTPQSLDKQTAEILLLGLLGDTGDFTFLSPQSASVFDMAKVLLTTANCEIQEFKSRYATISPRVFTIVQELVKNTSFGDISNWPKFMLTTLDRSLAEKNKYTDNEISDACNIYLDHFLRVVADNPWGFLITPRSDGSCRISLRSLPGSVNVRVFAEQLVGGGGHDRAAGGDFKPEDGKPVLPEDCIDKLKQWMATNTPVLS